MDAETDVVVVGGGVAGLTAAVAAALAGRDVLLVEGQLGGRAVTEEVGRYRFNRGAHAFYKKGVGRGVLKELGVRVSGASPPLRGAKARLGDQVGLLPVGAVSLARSGLLAKRDKVALGRLLAAAGRWRPDELADITATEWIDRLGVQDAGRHVVEMLTRLSSYTRDLDVISADVVVAQLQLAVGDGVDYLHMGWGSLVDGLAEAGRRQGVRHLGAGRVRQVAPDEGRVRVELEDGVVHGRRVVLAVGSPGATAAILPADPPATWQRLGPASRTACLDLGVREVPHTQVLLGLDRPIYCICHSPATAGLAPRGAGTVNLMRYLGVGDEPSKDAAMADFREHLALAGVDADRAEESRYLHRMVASSAQPTPAGGGRRGRPAVTDTGIDGVLVAGDWVGPNGYLADASLASGLAAARAADDSLDHAPSTRAVA